MVTPLQSIPIAAKYSDAKYQLQPAIDPRATNCHVTYGKHLATLARYEERKAQPAQLLTRVSKKGGDIPVRAFLLCHPERHREGSYEAIDSARPRGKDPNSAFSLLCAGGTSRQMIGKGTASGACPERSRRVPPKTRINGL